MSLSWSCSLEIYLSISKKYIYIITRNDKSPRAHRGGIQESTHESSHLRYFLWRNVQNDVGPVFISDPRGALCCSRITRTM